MKIIDISYYNTKIKGCDTCDYGAVYVNRISITWDDNIKVKFESSIKYEVMTEADWMILLANTSSRDEIIEAWKNKYLDYLKDNSIKDNKDYIYYETFYPNSTEGITYYLTES